MTQSFYTSISGMNAGQTKISVVADNIANMNTVGFKASKVNFSDVYYNTASVGKAPSGNQGGINPRQIGIGVNTASIARDFSSGTTLTTGLNTDLFINGSSFFTVSTTNSDVVYTRDGNFTVDSNGYLVNSSGYKVLGTDNILDTASSTTPIKIPTYISTVTTASTNDQMANTALSDLNGLMSGGVTDGAFTIVTYADDGTAKNHVINVNSEMTVQGLVDAINAQAGGAYTVTLENGGITMKKDGDTVRMEFKNGDVTKPDVEASNITTVMGFDAIDEDAGTYATQTLSYHQTISAGSPSDLNSENYSSIYINEDGIIDVKYGNGDTLSVMQDPDNPNNMVFKYTLNNGRVITGDDLTVFNDVVEPANLQIQLASFINPNGLIANGNNTYTVGPNSGMALYGSISSDAFGTVISGVLEGSNVDLASEFAEMVVAQRAIEANSRVFDTTNQILQTLSTLGR